MLIKWVSLVIAAALLPCASVSAQNLGGITVGDSKESALKVLQQRGKVTSIPDLNHYRTDDLSFNLCNGRVWGVYRQAGDQFSAFTRMSSAAVARYGSETETDVISEEGSQYVGAIHLRWKLSEDITYSLSVTVSGEYFLVTENFRRSTLCKNINSKL